MTANASAKYQQLASCLKRGIVKGDFPVDSLLPSENDLCVQYKIARGTARQAFAVLERERYLACERGRRRRVVARAAITSPGARPLVALIIRCQGHIYGDYSREIIRRIDEFGAHPLFYDVIRLIDRKHARRGGKLERWMGVDTRGMIVEGLYDFPFGRLKSRKIRNLVFSLHYEHPREIQGARYVLIDYGRGGYLGVKHLLERGCGNIAVIIYTIKHKPHNYALSFLDGCRKAFEETRRDHEGKLNVLTFDKAKQFARELYGLFRRKERPTGVFVLGDNRASIVYSAAREAGLAIPRDISVIGFYNTPWCGTFDPPLTSVSVREKKIAELTVRQLFKPDGMQKKIMVCPSLVVRGSSVAGLAGNNEEVFDEPK